MSDPNDSYQRMARQMANAIPPELEGKFKAIKEALGKKQLEKFPVTQKEDVKLNSLADAINKEGRSNG